MAIKKLIEVAIPLDEINAESAREKSIRHGHPSTLHLWWARRPLAAARAVIWSSLVDDPSSHPELFPMEEAQNKERERLFDILRRLVKWENSGNENILEEAKAEIMRWTNNNPPALLDPFAGGGAIPLEAQRLGLTAHAHDLNPVAVMINKAMIEIPPVFAGLPPVNPKAAAKVDAKMKRKGAAGLAEDVRFYGERMKKEAFKRIGQLYPKVKIPETMGGGEATVIAWIWARTVKCPNPACGCEMPLAKSFDLSKKKNHEFHIAFCHDENKITYSVKFGKSPIGGTVTRNGAICPFCGTSVDFPYIRSAGQNKEMSACLMAVVAEGKHGRIYLTPDTEQAASANISRPENFPSGVLSGKCRVSVPLYGLNETADLFTNRQLTALTTFSDLVSEAQRKAEADAAAAGMPDDKISLREGGRGARAYGEAVGVYLAFVIDKMADYHSSICSWHNSGEKMRNTFGRQAIPMIWDYAEANPFSNSSGCFDNMLEWIYKCILELPASGYGKVHQFDAQSDCGLREIMVSTDPPYYDNIGYADLSDFFYVWLRQSLKATYPKLFRTLLVPKAEELIATPYRFEGNAEKAKAFFEEGMLNTCRQLYKYAGEDIPVTIYYAYKQSETDEKEKEKQIASTGWETMLSAIIRAGFIITGTWPMRTEMANRSVSMGTNALASSIVLVCRKRPEDAPEITRRSFAAELSRELRPALKKLQASNIAPVDLAQSAIGPGMGVYSKYAKVLEADGKPMTVRGALQLINREIDIYFNEQDDELDRESRFCVELYMQSAFNDIKFGDADTLSRAKNTSVAALTAKGVLYAQKGVVHLLTREELPQKAEPSGNTIWLLCQQLTFAMEKGGINACAEIIEPIYGSDAERARGMAYRLYTVAERKNWTQEAYAYNSLVTAWQEIKLRAEELRRENAQLKWNLSN